MPTVVLARSEPLPVVSKPATATPSKAKAGALAKSARAVARRVAARIQTQRSLFGEAASPVSSTAKTQDLTVTGKSSPQAGAAGAPSRNADALKGALRRSLVSSGATVSPKPGSGADESASLLADRSSGSAVARRNGKPAAGIVSAANAAAWLIATGNVARFGLAQPRTLIGRSLDGDGVPDVDLGVLKGSAERVSRRHAEIIKHGSDYYIRDLGSLNGTYITGRGRLGRDQLYKLKDRDQVVFGGAKLEFRKS
jgi:predicted component of type VI protein secretion system